MKDSIYHLGETPPPLPKDARIFEESGIHFEKGVEVDPVVKPQSREVPEQLDSMYVPADVFSKITELIAGGNNALKQVFNDLKYANSLKSVMEILDQATYEGLIHKEDFQQYFSEANSFNNVSIQFLSYIKTLIGMGNPRLEVLQNDEELKNARDEKEIEKILLKRFLEAKITHKDWQTLKSFLDESHEDEMLKEREEEELEKVEEVDPVFDDKKFTMPPFVKVDGVVPDMPDIPPLEQVTPESLAEALGGNDDTETPYTDEFFSYINTLVVAGKTELKFLQNDEELRNAQNETEICRVLYSRFTSLKLSYEDWQTLKSFLDESRSYTSEQGVDLEKMNKNEIPDSLRGVESGTTPGEVPPPLPKVESSEISALDKELMEARAEYASQMVDYQNKSREKASKYARIMSELGVGDKKMPEGELPAELVAAQKAYTEAKKRKYESIMISGNEETHNIAGRVVETNNLDMAKASLSEYEALNKYTKALGEVRAIVNPETGETLPGFEINPKLVDLSEQERRLLQSRIVESMHPREKGIFAKATASFGKIFTGEGAQNVYARWEKLSPRERLVVRNVLAGLVVGTSILTFGGATLTGAAVVGGARIVRGMVGSGASTATGLGMDLFFEKKNQENREKILKRYAYNVNLDNLEEHDKKLAEDLKEQDGKRRRQILIKSGAMIAAGGISNLALTELQNLSNSASSVGVVRPRVDSYETKVPEGKITPAVDNTRTPQVGVVGNALTKPTDSLNVPKSPVQVELSSRGFIQTIDDMKEKLRAQYGEDIPLKIQENILDKSSIELAQEFGFYDAEHGRSGMGFKGEHLGVDSNGNVIYEHGGKKEIVSSEQKFTGRMMEAPEQLHPLGGVETAHAIESAPDDTQTSAPIEYTEVTYPTIRRPVFLDMIKHIKPAEIESGVLTFQFMGKSYDITNDGANKVVTFEGNKIAHASSTGMLQLEDKFQNGAEYLEVRKMYVNALSRMEDSPGVLTFETIPFEGGVVQVVWGDNTPGGNPKNLRVFMNGKEIAHGEVTVKGSKIDLNTDLKSGFWFKDTVYERAFKAVKPTLKGLKIIS